MKIFLLVLFLISFLLAEIHCKSKSKKSSNKTVKYNDSSSSNPHLFVSPKESQHYNRNEQSYNITQLNGSDGSMLYYPFSPLNYYYSPIQNELQNRNDYSQPAYSYSSPVTYGIPPDQGPTNGTPPLVAYGQPSESSYGPPPMELYVPPTKSTYGAPMELYAVPPEPSYGPPPLESYGLPPVESSYALPQPTYGPAIIETYGTLPQEPLIHGGYPQNLNPYDISQISYSPIHPDVIPLHADSGGSPVHGENGVATITIEDPPTPAPVKGSIDYVLIPLILIGVAAPIFVVLYVVLGALESKISPILLRSMSRSGTIVDSLEPIKPKVDILYTSFVRALETHEQCIERVSCHLGNLCHDYGVSHLIKRSLEEIPSSYLKESYKKFLKIFISAIKNGENCSNYKCA